MNRFLVRSSLAACLTLAWLSSGASAQLVSSLSLSPSTISPDGDGIQDTTLVRWVLADTASSVSVIVYEADSSSVVDTVYTGGLSDWIIRGVKGELYPCKPDIFEQTYEKA